MQWVSTMESGIVLAVVWAASKVGDLTTQYDGQIDLRNEPAGETSRSEQVSEAILFICLGASRLQ